MGGLGRPAWVSVSSLELARKPPAWADSAGGDSPRPASGGPEPETRASVGTVLLEALPAAGAARPCILGHAGTPLCPIFLRVFIFCPCHSPSCKDTVTLHKG